LYNPSFQVCERDGGEINHHTLDVLNINKNLLMGIPKNISIANHQILPTKSK
jgi:hypothetical protein